MSFTTPNFSAIRDAILADWQSLNPQIAITTDSDNYIRAAGFASAVEGLYQNQQWGVRQQFPDSSDSEYLERHCAMRGMTRKAAVEATGTVRITGTVGAAVPLATGFSVGSIAYVTTAAGVIGSGGTADILAKAVLVGIAGNQAANTTATLTSAPVGVASNATLLTMSSGAEIESDASLLARYLNLLRQPPRGGSKADWKRWAEEVPGVQTAYVYPRRAGDGTVDVCITTSTGVPSSQLLQTVVDYIEPLRPADLLAFHVVAPTQQNVPVTLSVSRADGYSLATVTASVNAALAAYFAIIAPGDTVYKSRLESLISDVEGVLDRTVSLPTANVVPTVNTSQIGWLILGTVVVT